jgi:hypothetical protein
MDTATTTPAPTINSGSLLITNASNATGQTTLTNLLTITFTGEHNPDATGGQVNGTTFYMRIATFSDAAYSAAVDTGTVAAATVLQIVLTGTMPESLIFCVGTTITAIGSVPNCATATTGAVTFNQLFSPTDTATATSQMAASTNAAAGYVITVSGVTLTNGSYTIAAMASAGVSAHGVSQFGLNLVANTGTGYASGGAFGLAVSSLYNGTNYKGQPIPASGYDVAENFRYVPGAAIANSANGGAGPSDGQIYTVSYIANVPGSQSAGTYVSTLTYICTPTF